MSSEALFSDLPRVTPVYYAFALVDEAFVIQGFKNQPNGFHEVGVHGFIVVLKIICRYVKGGGPKVKAGWAARRLASLPPTMPLIALRVVLQQMAVGLPARHRRGLRRGGRVLVPL